MSRPRIRTIKPEYPRHPKVRRVSRDARLLNIHLWNFADDEGRLQELPNSLIGDIFPTDRDVTVVLLEQWLTELADAGLIIRYTVEGEDYIQCHDFTDHQVINKARKSDIPTVDAGSVRSETQSGSSTVVVPSDSRPEVEREKEEEGNRKGEGKPPAVPASDTRTRRKPKRPDPDSIPEDFPPHLTDALDATLKVLHRIAEAKGANPPERLPVARAIAACDDRAHKFEAESLEQWWVHGKAANRSLRDVVAAYRKWLANADPVPIGQAPGVSPRRQTAEERGMDNARAWAEEAKRLEVLERQEAAA